MTSNVFREATDFVESCYRELNKTELEINDRLIEIKKQLGTQGYYTHTNDELVYGAKMAWRNSNRCIGRLFWENLNVVDQRHLDTEGDIIQAIFGHMEAATNQGRIRPFITIFSQKNLFEKVRIWNTQLIRYAGYQTTQGIVGDPDSVKFTEVCMKMGWKPKFGKFDILPLVIQLNEGNPVFFEIPDKLLLEVSLSHPHYKWFEKLKLKWYAVPFISNMSLEIGGITYTAAPFNGWYMGTEIGARNLADEMRYNLLPEIATMLELDVKSNSSLWKDRALLELNIAVLHSFKEAGVSIVDHHTAAQQFKKFEDTEIEAGRKVTGNWAWLIPPLAPATTHIFHKPYNNEKRIPNYVYQKPLY